MTLDFRNTNSLWASVLVETLVRLGLGNAIICPGSRSTPLTIALANHPRVNAIPILDERSASFFGLGLAKASHRPVVLVCTSGTAGANFYPAVIEAQESRIPLIVLTADRPPELRDCTSGQTIDQQKLFGNFPNWYHELAIPQADIALLDYLRQTVVQTWMRSHLPIPGPVHLNCPFQDPLPPIANDRTQAIAQVFNPETFFEHLSTTAFNFRSPASTPPRSPTALFPHSPAPHGLIIAGPTTPPDPDHYCQAVARLSQSLGWPVLAEGLSPLRNHVSLNPYLISTYDGILRNSDAAKRLEPEQVLQLGPLPTSKVLRQWLATVNPQRWIVDGGDRNLDALHGRTVPIDCTVEAFAARFSEERVEKTPYVSLWQTFDTQFRNRLNQTFQALSPPIESKLAWLLSRHLPENTPVFIANSMPVRDVEWFWQPSDRRNRPYFNRGANGIDGTLSTALGVAQHHQQAVLLTGDLALLHDTNGFLIRPHLQGHLTIILVNNNGGGIFEMLPVAQFEPPFETFFATPQNINFAALCHTYGVEHQLIKTWPQCIDALKSLPQSGIRLLELQTNRKTDARWRQETLQAIADELSID